MKFEHADTFPKLVALNNDATPPLNWLDLLTISPDQKREPTWGRLAVDASILTAEAAVFALVYKYPKLMKNIVFPLGVVQGLGVMKLFGDGSGYYNFFM